MSNETNPAESWEVLENAGMWNERKVHKAGSYKDAVHWRDEEYSPDEQEELGIDITCNGSTEY